MKIILMRHGEAERKTQQDNKRQLTKMGVNQAEETAEYILNKYIPDAFIVSPYDRAQQTLEAFKVKLPDVATNVLNNITPSDDPVVALKTLMNIEGECILIVCHMPIIAKITALLTAQYPEAYELAEARIIEAEFIGLDMGNEVDRFIPQQPVS